MPPAESSRSRTPLPAYAVTSTAGIDLARLTDGDKAIAEANARSERAEECWPIAELLRVKGELLLLQGPPEAAVVAEDHFRQSLDWARRQGALSWELPAAASLARLLRDQGRSADAVALL